ncbi:peptidylprolyl isomerase [Nostocaceae cyanobacterium CENA357]|uniref:Peptidylprolyl isomerase n=1 Tax=Atlanticothrix silvestris CENA357 TaxID=1725252 RepID=A0A8J7HIA1_9CYAN|nr:peptidylprolyl isomerase [Atlanticothrix silvestris]MBH8552918.1 peptidylprolyl isomerase [Atlanticothrix silvestris CENA357]
MIKNFILSPDDIIYQIKLSCQLPDIIEAIMIRKIIADAAAQAGIKVEKSELQQAADDIRLARNLVKAKDTGAWLEKHYLSLNDFKELAEIYLLSVKLANYLFAEQVEPFFIEHRLNYTATVTYEVVLDDQDLALELFYALQKNEICFQDIAHKYIQEPELRRVGGYCGIRYRSNFSPQIAACVFTAHPPQILKPIVTHKGVHLIWVEEIIQPQLNEPLRCQILADLLSAWLKQQLEEAKIVVQI